MQLYCIEASPGETEILAECKTSSRATALGSFESARSAGACSCPTRRTDQAANSGLFSLLCENLVGIGPCTSWVSDGFGAILQYPDWGVHSAVT